MPAKVEISASEIIVAPGSEEILEARLRNLGAVTETFSVAIAGPGQGWTVVDPPLVTLFPGAEQTLRVSVRPPRSSAITAGEMTMTVRVVPHNEPDEVTTADTVVRILAFDDRKISFVQPVARGRERAVYDLVVENDGNTRAACRLSLVDPTNRLGARFEPPSVAVEPGAREVVRVRVSGRHQRFAGQPLPHLVTVKAAEDGHATTQASATFLQAALIPEKLGRRFIALVLLAGLITATWFGVLKPAVDRAADRAAIKAADARVAVLQQSLGTADPAVVVTTTTTADGATVPVDEGDPFVRDWTLDAAPGDHFQTDALTVADGRLLRITDVFWSNEALDSGTLTLLRDGKTINKWALGGERNRSVPSRTAIEVTGGGNIAVRLDCSAPGEQTATQCEVFISVFGTEVDAPTDDTSNADGG